MNTGFSTPFLGRRANQTNYNTNLKFGDSLGIIKPEARGMETYIFNEIKNAGFKVKDQKSIQLDEHKVKLHYAELGKKAKALKKSGQDFLMNIYKRTVANMQKDKVTTFIVEGDEKEVARFKTFVGATNYKKRDPNSLRGKIEAKKVLLLKKQGKSEKEIENYRDEFTYIHASDTENYGKSKEKNYDREIRLHYPELKKSHKQ